MNSHLTDRELTMALDGELSPGDVGRIQEHLAACWTCRSRKLELERAIADFVRVYEDGPQSPAEGPRALLRARLAQAADSKRAAWIAGWPAMGWIAAGAACAIALIIGIVRFSGPA